MSVKKYSKDEVDKLEDQTDYERVEKMTDEEIEEGSKTDPDSLTPSDEDLKKFKKVKRK